MKRGLGSGLGLASLFCALMAAMPVDAQVPCLIEAEPNDQIDQAATVTGSGCFEGEIDNGSQDRFVWSIPDAEGAHGWKLGFEGGYANARVLVQSIKPADGTNPEAEGEERLRVDVPEGAYTGASPEFLLVPGRYLVDILSAGASPYRVRIAPTLPEASEVEPNDSPEQANALNFDTVVSGAVVDQPDVFAVTLTAAYAKRHTDIEINGALGRYLSAELDNAAGDMILRARVTIQRPIQIADLGLDAGTYYLKILPVADSQMPYTVKLTHAGPRIPGREEEPNDTLATAKVLAAGRPMAGRLSQAGDTDVYAFDVLAADTDKLLNFTLKERTSRSFCLTDAAGSELQCRHGTSVALSGLALPAGRYGLTVSGTDDPEDTYQILARVAGRRLAGTEAEPNDTPQYATTLKAGVPMKGQLAGQEDDFYQLHVEGDAQLWTMAAAGAGVDVVAVTDFQQIPLGSGESIKGTPGASATDVFLLPGDYWIKVTGTDGAYVLTATPTGPPDPSSEREPNNTDDQSQRLLVDQPRTGRLSDSSDRDVYRFSLFAPDHIRLT
ncbi:MAG: hypothetical protein ABIV25_03155, partial [Paracoccaceae bacterium]